MIQSISHITFIVEDLEKMSRFLREIFDAEEVYDSASKNFSLSREKFFAVGGTWVAVMEGESRPGRSYEHVAFKVADSEFDDYVSRVERLGVDIKRDRGRVEGEARSLYFHDYDNHLFELHTGTLGERLARYAQR
ncbi:MAG: FosX/FosE/FosI family fosfomycin resistance thiol transferase [Candidatus Lindowbacteria bacterium]|nr:FosX/FosE/FosI family fosfomycin resistance thiol transferase [Candidatus Lindowbacteria bacterium]